MIIVGLGNPGEEFIGTRHNVGFVVLDTLAKELDLHWAEDRSVAWARYNEHWLLKPLTYMNRSGSSLNEFFRWHNLATDSASVHQQLIVVHDDLDFPVGTSRIQRDRSSAGHNGVQSIIDAFSSKDFTRIRIGIGTPETEVIPTEDFVLQQFLPTEREGINEQVTETVRQLRAQVE